MSEIFTPDYRFFWASLLALALYWPIYRVLLSRAMHDASLRRDAPPALLKPIKKKSAIIAAVICAVFAFSYTTFTVQG